MDASLPPPIKRIREAAAAAAAAEEEEEEGGAEASGMHAPLAGPLPRRFAGNLRNEIGSSPVSVISPSNSLSFPSQRHVPPAFSSERTENVGACVRIRAVPALTISITSSAPTAFLGPVKESQNKSPATRVCVCVGVRARACAYVRVYLRAVLRSVFFPSAS